MTPIDAARLDPLREQLGDRIHYVANATGDSWLIVPAEKLSETCRVLKEAPEYAFDLLNLISGVDYLHTDARKARNAGWDPHLQVVYHLSSTRHLHSLVLKVMLPRWKDGRAGILPELPSVSGLWRTADWHEREVYDLVGVRFVGHPGLRRILCPEDWQGHPLRRDYQMPVEYHGIRSPGPEPPQLG